MTKVVRNTRKIGSTFSSQQLSLRKFSTETEERVKDNFDVVIVGGGPSGLASAIRLKQLAEKSGKELRVVVVEKGPEIGMRFCDVNS